MTLFACQFLMLGTPTTIRPLLKLDPQHFQTHYYSSLTHSYSSVVKSLPECPAQLEGRGRSPGPGPGVNLQGEATHQDRSLQSV